MSTGLHNSGVAKLKDAIANHEAAILEQWIREMSASTRRTDLANDSEIRSQCSHFLKALRHATESGTFELSALRLARSKDAIGGDFEIAGAAGLYANGDRYIRAFREKAFVFGVTRWPGNGCERFSFGTLGHHRID